MLTNADLRALYVLAADYHSGMWSRGYRLMCHATRVLNKRDLAIGCGCRPDGGAEHWQHIRETPEYAKWLPMAEAKF